MAAAGWSPAPPDGRGRTSAPPPPQVSCSGRVRHAPPPSTQIEVVGRAWSSAPTRGRRGTTGWRKLRRRPVSLSAATAAGGPSRARALKAAAARHLRLCAHTLEVAAAPRFAVRAEEVTTSGPTGSSHSHLRGSAPSCCRLRLDCNSRIEILERGRKGFFLKLEDAGGDGTRMRFDSIHSLVKYHLLFTV
jgi:hypothetical protein